MSGIAEQPDDEQRDRHQCQPDADKQQLPAEQSRAEGLAFRVVVVRTREQRPRAMARGLAAVGPLVEHEHGRMPDFMWGWPRRGSRGICTRGAFIWAAAGVADSDAPAEEGVSASRERRGVEEILPWREKRQTSNARVARMGIAQAVSHQ